MMEGPILKKAGLKPLSLFSNNTTATRMLERFFSDVLSCYHHFCCTCKGFSSSSNRKMKKMRLPKGLILILFGGGYLPLNMPLSVDILGYTYNYIHIQINHET